MLYLSPILLNIKNSNLRIDFCGQEVKIYPLCGCWIELGKLSLVLGVEILEIVVKDCVSLNNIILIYAVW